MIKSQNSIIEFYFYMCYYAYILGDITKAKIGYSLIKDEYKNKGLSCNLKQHQLLELKKIKDALNSGNISHKKWQDTVKGPLNSNGVKIQQKELVKKIHTEGIRQLQELLQDNIELYNIEQPCGSYGVVDMVYMGKNTVYPIEVKCKQGDHSLIGQIGKYNLYHQLHLHYKHYEHVQSITLCNSYNSFALNEMKSMGIKTFIYSLTRQGIKIEEI